MNITKIELLESLLQARTALAKDIRDFTKHRNSYLGGFFRKALREKIAAYRVLGNLDTINATTYTHNKRNMAKVKKALAL
jgi:hypothetical protein